MSSATPPPLSILAPILIILTSLKLLLIPSSVYRSTDFDVHRNWLAITRHLPLERWYFDDVNGTTVHTLDYPPSFAFFEYALSNNPITDALLDGEWLDERCLALLGDDENEPSEICVAFQRLTVVMSDAILIAGAMFASRSVHRGDELRSLVSTLLIVLNPGLVLLDHVHFQYNGMLLGLLLLSIGCVVRGARSSGESGGSQVWNLIGAATYAYLLTMKHLYIILGPLYFFHLLRHHCFMHGKFSSQRFFTLAVVTGSTLILPFAPFLLQPPGVREQLTQIVRRLFPFQRGLCHDYWAANVWALYLFADKIFRFVVRRVGLSLPEEMRNILPMGLLDVSPSVTALCLLLGLAPACTCAWRAATSSKSMSVSERPTGKSTTMLSEAENENQKPNFFVCAVVFSSFSGFMLAYHVHEKAIMTAIIPLTILAPMSIEGARLYLRTCALGHFGLLPLLYRPQELIFKVSSYVAHLALATALLEVATSTSARKATGTKSISSITLGVGGTREMDNGLLTTLDKVGLTILSLVFIFMEAVHPLFLKPMGVMEFLPLLATSVTCATGLVGCWICSGAIMARSMKRNKCR